MRFCKVVAGAGRFASTFVNPRELEALRSSLVHNARAKIDVFQLQVHLNIIRCVGQYLIQNVHRVIDLSVACKYLSF